MHLAELAERVARNPSEQLGRAVARVFDFGLDSGKVYTGVVRTFLAPSGDDEPLWKIRHTDGDEEDLDKYELAYAYHKLEMHQAEQSKSRKRRRELTSKVDGEWELRRRRRHGATVAATGSNNGGDIGPLPPGPVTYGHVLRALSEIEIPVQSSRTNVTRGTPPRGLVLGAVNIRSHGGMQAAQATREKPNLARLLAAFFRYQCGDPLFRYTTIQINANYEAALHVDKFNLGPSYISGVGDWGPPTETDDAAESLVVSEEDEPRPPRNKVPPELAGRLWVQGRGALDCRECWVAFDGNTPHCTLPFSGTRFTLIYFTHCSQSILKREDRLFLDDLGFAMPHHDITKAPHMRTAEERLEAGRVAWRAFLDELAADEENRVCDQQPPDSGAASSPAAVDAPSPPPWSNKAAADEAAAAFILDGTGGRPSSRVAQLCGLVNGKAPELRRHFGLALRKAAEETEAMEHADRGTGRTRSSSCRAIKPVFVTGNKAGLEASVEDSCLTTTNEELANKALVDRPEFVPYIEPWETAIACKKDERGGARLLAKYAGLHLIDDDPFELGGDDHDEFNQSTSDAVIEANRARARQAREAGEKLAEHRAIVGVEWCRFARRWTVITQLAEPNLAKEDTFEKYPIDKELVRMIVAASEYNASLRFYDADECRAKFERRKVRARARSSAGRKISDKPGDSDILPGLAVRQMIEDDLAIVVNLVNPKKGRSADRYEKYKHARTCTQYLDLGGSRADLQFDFIRGHVNLDGGLDWRALDCVLHHRSLREQQRQKQQNDDQQAAAPACAAESTEPTEDVAREPLSYLVDSPAAPWTPTPPKHDAPAWMPTPEKASDALVDEGTMYLATQLREAPSQVDLPPPVSSSSSSEPP